MNGDANSIQTNGTKNNATNGVAGHEQAVQLPSAKAFDASANVRIQPPLSRRGHGPGLILLVPTGLDLNGHKKTLDPPPLQKWAEEGYAVSQITLQDAGELQTALEIALQALRRLEGCDSDEKMGLISYDASITNAESRLIDASPDIVAVVTHGASPLQLMSTPQQLHTPGASTKTPTQDSNLTVYSYMASGEHFAVPAHSNFRSAPAAVLHTRCLSFLKPLMGGPYFDLEAIWDEHTRFEFGERAVEKTMGTMVQEPYVNHVPTLTGGIGRAALTRFYAEHFVFNNPEDTAMELVSRTVGIDRVIDEFVFSFTHDRMIDWLAPGIPPTHQHVELPFTSVVNIRGDRLYHEHIAWDQATLLRQLGLLPEYLPFPYALPDGRKPAEGKRFEYQVPAAGVETSRKLVDERSVESNQLFECKVREVDDT